jgi:outer membrane protein assembly factor BamB
MCFDEKAGEFMWQLDFPKREEDPYMDWPQTGSSSPVTVDGDRVYHVNNRGEVLCLDPARLDSGSSSQPKPKILWLLNLTREAGIWSHDAAHSSILVRGEYLYLNTGTGVDNTHKMIRTPEAPSLVVLEKKTGRLVARDHEAIAPNIFHSTWASPSMGEVNGRLEIFFAGGNGVLYGFKPFEKTIASPGQKNPSSAQPTLLEKIWEYDFDPSAPKTNVHKYNSNRREGPSNFYGMPVFHNNRIYVAGGGDLWWGKTEAWLKCIDATKTGNITSNATVWTFPLQKHVLSTVAISGDLLFIADCGRGFYCLDVETGKQIWSHQIEGEVWASPMVADGKVYLGTRAGMFYVWLASREKKLISAIQLGNPITATATAANGVLFVATMTQLFAVEK